MKYLFVSWQWNRLAVSTDQLNFHWMLQRPSALIEVVSFNNNYSEETTFNMRNFTCILFDYIDKFIKRPIAKHESILDIKVHLHLETCRSNFYSIFYVISDFYLHHPQLG